MKRGRVRIGPALLPEQRSPGLCDLHKNTVIFLFTDVARVALVCVENES